MTDKPENPYAFPTLETAEQWGTPGMDLRDWFAGQALAAFLSSDADEEWNPENASIVAYEYADAMLKQREEKE